MRIKRKSSDYNFSVKTRKYGNEIEYVVIFDDFPHLIGAGETVDEAISEGLENLDAYLEYCYKESIPVPEPSSFEFKQESFSGKITFRMSKELHKQAAFFAEKQGISLNSLINEAVISYMGTTKLKDMMVYLDQYKDLLVKSTRSFFSNGEAPDFSMSFLPKWPKEREIINSNAINCANEKELANQTPKLA